MADSKTKYKETLNLPKTSFPMKANLANREPNILKRWEQLGLYQQLREMGQGRKKFILHDGPPYANGAIHLGHAVNKILKDIIVKAKTLSGFDSPYIPGWDCHGLPIELNVEKKIGKAGVKVDAAKFRQACRDYANKQVAGQSQDFQRLGVVADWQNPYLTMDFESEADIVRALGKIIAAGHLHKGSKPVHWCIDCGSALAEAEVEYQDKTSPAIDVRFSVVDPAAVVKLFGADSALPSKPLSVLIWTTTPWTLPANQAVALNAKLDYALVQIKSEECVIVASLMVDDIMQRYEIEDYQVLAHCNGELLEKQLLNHPFYARQVPIVLGDHVTTEAGTGAVHTAPGHGQDDYIVAMKYGLEIENPVGGNGCFLPNTPLLAGEHVFKANVKVLDILKEKSALMHDTKVQHSYPHCWRHRSPIIFRATPQWFISMTQNGLRDQAIEEINHIQWLPDWGKSRIEGMINNRPDWCISRQRTWGVPIPLFVHKQTGELHPDTAQLIETVAQKIEKTGIEAWFALEPSSLLGDAANDYDKVMDTLDVWFDSGVTHEFVLSRDPNLQVPADLYLEGSDQHRGWFQSSLLTSVAIRGKSPYKTALTHGFTVNAKGEKMSKSLGNAIEPQKVVGQLGADIIRLWAASTDYSSEMTVSDEIFKRTADAYRRMRNTLRFLLSNLHGFDPSQHQVELADMLSLDRWAVRRCDELQSELLQLYDRYEFHHIYQKIHNFCNVDLGSFYLDVIKDRQYTTQVDSVTRRSAQTAMYHIIEALTRWLAPILSFTAEEIWPLIPGDRSDSVFFEKWYNLPQSRQQDSMDLAYWIEVLEVRQRVAKQLEALRAKGEIGSSLDAEVKLYCSERLFQELSKLEDELRFVLITSYAQVYPLSAASNDLPTQVLTGDEKIAIEVKSSDHDKCVRCWHHRDDVGQDSQHPQLCSRCVSNVAGGGESRRFA